MVSHRGRLSVAAYPTPNGPQILDVERGERMDNVLCLAFVDALPLLGFIDCRSG